MVTKKVIEFYGLAKDIQKLADKKFDGNFTSAVRFVVREYFEKLNK